MTSNKDLVTLRKLRKLSRLLKHRAEIDQKYYHLLHTLVEREITLYEKWYPSERKENRSKKTILRKQIKL